MSRHKTPRLNARTWELYSDTERADPVRANKPRIPHDEHAAARGRVVPRMRQQFHRAR